MAKSLLDHPFLPNRQEWLLMDHRGNWEQMDESIGVPPVTVDEYRTVNMVNEQDGPMADPTESAVRETA